MKLLRVFPCILGLSICVLCACVGCERQSTQVVPDGIGLSSPVPIPGGAREILEKSVDPGDGSWSSLRLAPRDFGLSGDLDSLFDIFNVTFLWGEFSGFDSSTPSPIDWSGGLSASVPSAMRVKALIDFEEGRDSLLTRSDLFHLDWVSLTVGDFDGLSVLIFVPKDLVVTVVPELFFETRALNLQWFFSDLEELDAFYPVDDVNGLAVHARKLHPPFCARGTMEGDWIKASSFDDHGRFKGLWLGETGDTLGYVSGKFWTTLDHKRLMKGSVSGFVTDQVIAHLKGHWFYDDDRLCPMCGVGHGRFMGKIRLLESGAAGEFRGEFGDFSLPPNDLVMPFSGAWKIGCRDRSAS